MDPHEIGKLVKRTEKILSKFKNYDLPLEDEPRVKQLLLECMEVFNEVFGADNTYTFHIQHDYYDNLGGILGNSVSQRAVEQMLATVKAADAQAQRIIERKQPVPVEVTGPVEESTMMDENRQEIFISHSSKDKFVVDEFVDVILDNGIGIRRAKIFCTSVEGMGVKSGEDFRERLRTNLRGCKVAILLATPNYKLSEICLNEMGAAWSLDCRVLPCIAGVDTDFQEVGVLLNPKQAENLLVETDLDDLKEAIEKELKMDQEIPPATWTVQKRKFLKRVELYLKDNPYPDVVTNAEFQKLKKRNENIEAAIGRLLKENSTLKEMNDAFRVAKDKKEVEAIEEKYSDKSEMEAFKQHIKLVRESLEKFNSVVNSFIYRSVSGKNLKIEYAPFESEIQEAIAQGYLTDDEDEPDVNWGSTSDIGQARESIDKLEKFLESKPREKLFEWHMKKYGIKPDLSNLDFWRRIIGVKITYK